MRSAVESFVERIRHGGQEASYVDFVHGVLGDDEVLAIADAIGSSSCLQNLFLGMASISKDQASLIASRGFRRNRSLRKVRLAGEIETDGLKEILQAFDDRRTGPVHLLAYADFVSMRFSLGLMNR